MTVVLMLGSGPMAMEAAGWPRAGIDRVLAINNAWAVRPDWDFMIHPWDFPKDRRPLPGPGQHRAEPRPSGRRQARLNQRQGQGQGMAFTAAYWALHALRPRVIGCFGCDMHYPKEGRTHFYGQGTPDPLREDITLRSLPAKAARLMVLAAMQGCAMVNLSRGPSRLVFPRLGLGDLAAARPLPFDAALARDALGREAALGYHVPSGRYWEEAARFEVAEVDALDALWLRAAQVVPNGGDPA